MATWQVALVREQGVHFGVVVVEDHVIDNVSKRVNLINWWSAHLGMPAVLMGAQRHRLFGRDDIVRFLSRVAPSRLPWRQLSVAA